MNKINGYTEEEAKHLVEYIQEGKKKGKTLTSLFATYGLKNGRAKGSVRNYYYTLMKNEKGDERIVKLLDGKTLSVEKIRAFTEEEADEAIRSILAEKSKGISVRRAIFNLSGGDDKLMLRLQNKYRNTLKKNPEKIAAIRAELGIEEAENGDFSGEKGKNSVGVSLTKGKRGADKEFLQRRLEREINALYDRLAKGLKEENERLLAENKRLKERIVEMQKSC
ncbi:MAG: hypothetical protein IKC37_01415 [Clostridia bacterium]|nr:hypothetical protein [Clostridia bacterium]